MEFYTKELKQNGNRLWNVEDGHCVSPFCPCGEHRKGGTWGWCPQDGEWYCPDCVGKPAYPIADLRKTLPYRRYFSFVGWIEVPDLHCFIDHHVGGEIKSAFKSTVGARVRLFAVLDSAGNVKKDVGYLRVWTNGRCEEGLVVRQGVKSGHVCGTSTAAISYESKALRPIT